MKFKAILILSCTGLLFVACKKDDNSNVQLDGQLEAALELASSGAGKPAYILPLSNEYGKIPQDPQNPITKAKVDLGQLLYHETGLAVNPKHAEGKGTYACASCHFASAGFQAGRHQGISDGGSGFGVNGEGRIPSPVYDLTELDVQAIRTPSALNIAYQEAILWNGQFGATGPNVGTQASWTPGTPKENNNLGYQGTETQAIAGLTVHRMKCDETAAAALAYKALFDAVFPGVDAPKRYDNEHAGLAIAAYERTLLANKAPFQRWLRGESKAMSDQQKRGAILFFDKAGCASCHNGPSLANMEFHALGMKDLFENPQATYGASGTSCENKGRACFTNDDADLYKFKVPQLYNLADSPFYGHGASFTNIRDVVVYKSEGVKQNANVPDGMLASRFKPLHLTEAEINDITAFLKDGLYDPDLLRFQPLSVHSGGCIPMNDPEAKMDLGCN